MPKKTLYELEDAFFDVDLSPIYTSANREEGGQLLMFDQSIMIPGFKALKRVSDGYIFAVVRNSYKLITNKQAFELGKKCFKQVFGEDKTDSMEFFNLRMPSSQSYCTMDFLSKQERVCLGENADEEWRLFLRISNSYNRKMALKFDIGFCRMICKNGMIFGKNSIEFKYCHNRNSDSIEADFKLKYGAISAIKEMFRKKIELLNAKKFTKSEFMPEISRVLQFRAPKNEKEEIEAKERDEHLDNLIDSYIEENGETAYALLNVLTDYASRPAHCLSALENDPDTLERRVGEWMLQYVS